MSELVEFLLARISEDEAVAVATRDAHDPLDWSNPGVGPVGLAGPVDGPSGYESVVIDPARVLRECEAKRRIVALHSEGDKGTCYTCSVNGTRVQDNLIACPTLRDLAAVYADHPDYRDEWRP